MAYGDPVHNKGKTLAGMQNRLRIELGNRTDLTPALLAEWINDSYRDLAASLELPELKRSLSFLTTAGEEGYVLPANVGVISAVSWQDAEGDEGAKLDKIDEDAYRKLPFESGVPKKFIHAQGALALWPVPDEVLTVVVDFRVKVVNLTEDTHSPIIDEEFHEAIYLGAKARGFDALKDFTSAQVMENRQIGSIRKKLDKRAQEDEGKTGQLRVVRRQQDLGRLRPQRYNPDQD